MLSQSVNTVIPDQAVSYKFKVPEFAELFESLSPEQIHISLEGALNIIFAQPSKNVLEAAANDDSDEMEDEQNEEEDQLDHEAAIVAATTFALFAHQQGLDAEASGVTEMVPVEDPENTPQYAQLEDTFRAIVDKFAEAISADEYNQDITTLYGEMQFFNHIELFTYNYDTKHEVLGVTIVVSVSGE